MAVRSFSSQAKGGKSVALGEAGFSQRRMPICTAIKLLLELQSVASVKRLQQGATPFWMAFLFYTSPNRVIILITCRNRFQSASLLKGNGIMLWVPPYQYSLIEQLKQGAQQHWN